MRGLVNIANEVRRFFDRHEHVSRLEWDGVELVAYFPDAGTNYEIAGYCTGILMDGAPMKEDMLEIQEVLQGHAVRPKTWWR